MDTFTKILWNEDEFDFDYYKNVLHQRVKSLENDKLFIMLIFFGDNYRIKNGLYLIDEMKKENKYNINILNTYKCILMLMDKKFSEFYKLYKDIEKNSEIYNIMLFYENKIYKNSKNVFTNLNQNDIILYLHSNFELRQYIEPFILDIMSNDELNDEFVLYYLIDGCFFNDKFKECCYYCHIYTLNNYKMYIEQVEDYKDLSWTYMPQHNIYLSNKKIYNDIVIFFRNKVFINKIDLDVYYEQYISQLPNIID
jgi:hypothetical protein